MSRSALKSPQVPFSLCYPSVDFNGSKSQELLLEKPLPAAVDGNPVAARREHTSHDQTTNGRCACMCVPHCASTTALMRSMSAMVIPGGGAQRVFTVSRAAPTTRLSCTISRLPTIRVQGMGNRTARIVSGTAETPLIDVRKPTNPAQKSWLEYVHHTYPGGRPVLASGCSAFRQLHCANNCPRST